MRATAASRANGLRAPFEKTQGVVARTLQANTRRVHPRARGPQEQTHAPDAHRITSGASVLAFAAIFSARASAQPCIVDAVARELSSFSTLR